MTTDDIRRIFLEYFKKEGHTIVPSSSLVPESDPTLLFTNAGMVQFKQVFLGKEPRPYTRAASAQRCVRAGGKHNDLEKVGYTNRHHTFFEMLGNFSFGDYFKREAIQFAWNFLTKVLNLPQEKLWISVYKDDSESEKIWLKEIKIDPTRFSHGQDKDNFWAMADTGPCGPCSEIFYDHGPTLAGGPPGSETQDGDRYTELWNLVFMQYNRLADLTLVPLPKPSVDTGMGLERIAAVLQGVHSNYETDIFHSLIASISLLAPPHSPTHSSFRVIADHIRSSSFLMISGVTPSNEGRGYVLRRIIRRALRHGAKLNIQSPFFYSLVKPLAKVMGAAHPELIHCQAAIEECLHQEERLFSKTLMQGLAILETELSNLSGAIIPGHLLFRLYDTYGFPIDLVSDIAKEKNLTLDTQGFEAEMAKQRERARATRTFEAVQTVRYEDNLPPNFCTVFSGYETLHQTCRIVLLTHEGRPVQEIQEGEKATVILDRTPFYPEGGGQVGDTGVLDFLAGQFVVKNTEKEGPLICHHGEVKRGVLRVGVNCEALVDDTKRHKVAANHSATHLLHAALRRILGDTALQKGSLVHPDTLRFDFSYNHSLTDKEVRSIEALVNQMIRLNSPVETSLMTPQEALKIGAIGLFENKYAAEVRVLKMGEVSLELCGGTHVKRTGDIGFFKIISEGSIAAGIRRIEALTGEAAVAAASEREHLLKDAAELLKIDPPQFPDKLKQLLDQNKKLEKTIAGLQTEVMRFSKASLLQKVKEKSGVKILVAEVAGMDTPHLRALTDELKNCLGEAVILLASIHEDAVILVGNVSAGCQARLPANQLVQFAASHVGGKGGGRVNMAQGGGPEPAKLPEALTSTLQWILEHV
ncbi:MAG: alanine--tRNA ligase [Gammaproteobacteria bacterium]|nr:alanine--tRNA ligase [Gammaproteobacteria bacterium]